MALNEDQQTEAVFKSSRDKVDPVSGNEVPPGSLPEEVRDDIPAMLSEGEYVVPADVLRFYGVKFFEDLRVQAKMGLAEMEANGRIGGEPIEEETGDVGISDEELMVIMAQAPQEEQTVGAANGGLMGFAPGGLNYPAYIKQPDITQFGMAGPDFQGGLEYRTYVNDAGMEITIPFFDGQPMGMIPPGYTLKSDAATATEKAAPKQTADDAGPSPGDVPTSQSEAVDYSALSEDQLNDALAQNQTATAAVTAVSAAVPGIGLFGIGANAALSNQRSNIKDAMEAKGMDVPDDDSPLDNIIDGIKGLFGKDKDKDTTPTEPTPNEGEPTPNEGEPEPFSGTPQGPTPAQEAQAAQEATIGLEAFGGDGNGGGKGGDNDPGENAADAYGDAGVR